MGYLQVLFHTLVVNFNSWVLLFSVTLIILTVLISNWKIKFGEIQNEN